MTLSLGDLVDLVGEFERNLEHRLCGLAVRIASNGEVREEAWARPITRFDFDDDSEEFLLFVDDPKYESSGEMPQSSWQSLGELVAFASTNASRRHFAACIAELWSEHDTTVRIDYPVIGTGENPPRQRFFAVVRDDQEQDETES